MRSREEQFLDLVGEDIPLDRVERETEYLSSFLNEQRFDLLKSRVALRTDHITIALENIFHPQNASAVVRSAEAFGVQHIHVIENECPFRPNFNIAKGADKWLDIERYPTSVSSEQVIDSLKAQGYKIAALTPHREDCTPQSVDVSDKIALFMGTEKQGISEVLKQKADYFVRIPMSGFTESLNVSVCAAIILQTLSERLRNSSVEWQLSEQQQKRLLHRWVIYSMKDPRNILKRFYGTDK